MHVLFCVLPAAAETTPLINMSNGISNGQESPEESTDSVMTVSSSARVSHDGNLFSCARGTYTLDNAPLDVRLEFQGKSGGLVVFKDQKHLNIVPPVGATNCE